MVTQALPCLLREFSKKKGKAGACWLYLLPAVAGTCEVLFSKPLLHLTCLPKMELNDLYFLNQSYMFAQNKYVISTRSVIYIIYVKD